jgi:hypothetical protein
MRRTLVVVLLVWLALTGIASSSPGKSDPPILLPWHKIGDIALGESRARVETEYGSVGHGYHVLQRYGDTVQGYYRLHRSQVIVTFYGSRVGELISPPRTTAPRAASALAARSRSGRVTEP